MKSNILRSVLTATVLLGLVATINGCSSATPTDTPGVERLGQYILKQFGPELWTVLGYRYTSSKLGEEWMILEIGLSSPSGQVAKVTREDIFVRSPSGATMNLPTQEEFNEAYGTLRPMIAAANVDRDPLDYFPLSRIECAVQFFVTPGEGVSFDEVTVNDKRACYGRLYFKIPGGIQAGRWTFGINQPESEIRIPFEIGQ